MFFQHQPCNGGCNVTKASEASMRIHAEGPRGYTVGLPVIMTRIHWVLKSQLCLDVDKLKMVAQVVHYKLSWPNCGDQLRICQVLVYCTCRPWRYDALSHLAQLVYRRIDRYSV